MGGQKRFTVADFFSGAGGFSEGFRQEGFNVVFALDNWKPAVDTHNLNHPECNCILKNILEIDTPEKIDEIIPDTDMIIGSPPCVAFSGSNKAGKANKSLGIQLIEAYLRIIAWKKKKGFAKYWILENVPNSGKYIKKKYTWKELGLPGKGPDLKIPQRYTLNAAEYGAPQGRKRFVCGDFILPKKTHDESNWVTTRHVLDMLTNPQSKPQGKIKDPNYGFKIDAEKLTDHFYDTRVAKFEWKKAKRLKVDHGFMGKMSFPENLDRPSRTVMATLSASTREAMIFDSFNHQGKHNGYRQPTIREVASFMSFPITYHFEANNESSKYRLVGNAVCPKLFAALARAIAKKEGLYQPRKFIPLPKVKPSVNLNGIKKRIKEPRPRKPDAKFERHVPHIKIQGMRVQLSNTKSDFKKENIRWTSKLHFGSAKNHKAVEINNKEIEQLFKKNQTIIQNIQKIFDKFKFDVMITFKDKMPNSKELQDRYCNWLNEDSTPDGVLMDIKYLVDKHFPEKKFNTTLLDNSKKTFKIEKDKIPLRIAAAAFGCKYAIEQLSSK